MNHIRRIVKINSLMDRNHVFDSCRDTLVKTFGAIVEYTDLSVGMGIPLGICPIVSDSTSYSRNFLTFRLIVQ